MGIPLIIGILNLLFDYKWIPRPVIKEFPITHMIINLTPLFIGIAVIAYLFKKYTPHLKKEPSPSWDMWLVLVTAIFMLLFEVWVWVHSAGWV